MSREITAASRVCLAAGQLGYWMMRNNSGVLNDKHGTPVRFGLGNESAKLNKEIKSSDYIGIAPMVITREMVGSTVGVFLATEIKKEGWRLIPSDDRGHAQQRFITEVRQRGGMATFASNETHLLEEVIRWTAEHS